MRRVAALIGVLAGLAAAPAAAQADVLYAAGVDKVLYELSLQNGQVVKTVGPIGKELSGLSIDPRDGALYGVEQDNVLTPAHEARSLIRIDKGTGAATPVSTLFPNTDSPGEIAIAPDGAFYGWLEPDRQDLATVDPTTGTFGVVGESGLTTSMAGLAFSPAGGLFLAGDDGSLHTVNRVTGAAPAGPALSEAGLGIASLAFDTAGTLFGLRERTDGMTTVLELVTIDTGTGAVAVRGQVSDTIVSIAIGPSPSEPGQGPGSGGPGPGTAPDKTAPSVTRFRVRDRVFRAARRGPSVAASRGTRVSFRLSEPATARFTVQRRMRSHGVFRYQRVRGAFSRAGKAGTNRFRFTGRLRGRALRVGAYRLVLRATDPSGNVSPRAYATFRIVRR
jgi:hypothetical protein